MTFKYFSIQYFTIYRQYFLIKFWNNFHEYLIQHFLKSGGAKDYLRREKVPGTAPYNIERSDNHSFIYKEGLTSAVTFNLALY